MPRSAFVTGATGFLGRHLVEQLLQAGFAVTCFHRAGSKLAELEKLGVKLRAGVLHERASVAEAIPAGVDAVFHVAANTSTWSKRRDEQWRDNVLGTEAVALAAAEKGAKRFVLTSTVGVYGLSLRDNLELTESSPRLGTRSRVMYERSKAEAEERALLVMRERGLPVVILQPPHIMGRYDTVNWARLIAMVHQGKLPGVPPGDGQWAQASDVARTHLAALERGRPGERYLLNGAQATFLELAQALSQISGRSLKTRVLPRPLLFALAQAQQLASRVTGREPQVSPEAARMTCSRSRIVSTKARDELGHEVSKLREMAEESYRWLESQGRLEKK